MIFTYKNESNNDVSSRLSNCGFAPHASMENIFQNKRSSAFEYLSWNRQLQNSLQNTEVVVQLLDCFFKFHKNGLFTFFDDSFYSSIRIIMHCLNIYNDTSAASLLIRIKIYKIFIYLIRFVRLSKFFLNLLLKTVCIFLVGSSDDDTLYSIQVISLLSSYYLSAKYFKLFTPSCIQVFIKLNNLSIMHSLCNILLNMSHYHKTNSQYVHQLFFAVIEIIPNYQNQIIISKCMMVIFNLSKVPLVDFQDFLLKTISIQYNESQKQLISLLDFLQDCIVSPKNMDSNYDKNIIITIFRIFRRLVNYNNLSYFICIEDIFQYINSQNSCIQYYCFKFLYYYLKYFNYKVSTSSFLYINFLNILRNFNHQVVSRIFSISAIEGALKVKSLGFLVISELFKIPSFFNDLTNFCDKTLIESLCSLFEIQNNFLFYDSISGILLNLINSEKKIANGCGKDYFFTNLIVKTLSIDVLEYICDNSTCSNNVSQLICALKRFNS